ncbi:MAG: peptidase M16 [Candidatus Dactylopiibacterium carminicum]|uniref:Insulinase family protein n=1 Tax=Candidatus Dactylopiibacterium carminicum TaxID=857335 RepID=A0A272EYA5_9RHOO|nr:pitrilysin family protein [Candidatus Dactylopiibacterium carminicum]KAF7600464.1 insulinase family protein [Candidatus Dactylopiibacterium carminicum]PAS95085.1 MAG: peptidase M16 [Candidatus Dactylopiibacterium carminicum]PAT00461.1 MAG: peptidase M16 [Candidatus Dactylopiibacterium carminicum]
MSLFPLALRALLGACLLAALPALANPFETTLDNGLKVIVKEDHRAPTVTHMVWYRVGSLDEFNGTTGVAHALEHMMFKGTAQHGPGEFNKLVAAAGGRDNAFTNQDYTAYFQLIPRERLAQMMALEADRMANLVIQDDLFAKEIEVIKEERRWRTDDKPRARLYETLMAAVYNAHPYGRPVIGWMPDLDNMSAQDLRDWYARWYGPNNAVLVVVGDVDHETVFRQAQETYGKLPARVLPVRKAQTEPAQAGVRRVTVKAPAELPYLMLAWRAPALTSFDSQNPQVRQAMALQLLSAVLDGYDGARLNRGLVRERKLAVSAGAGYDPVSRGQQSLFLLEGVPAKGVSVARLEAALRGEIARVAKNGVTSAELSRIKAQMLAGKVFSQDSNMGQAMQIASLEMGGFSWRDEDTWFEALRGIRADEVQAAAKLLLGDDTLTVAELVPQPVDPKAQQQAPDFKY